MPNVLELKQQAAELNRDVGLKIKECEEGKITVADFATFMDGAEKKDAEIASGIKAYTAANKWRSGSDPEPDGAPQAPEPDARMKLAQANWATYKEMQGKAQANLVNRGSGKGDFTFEVMLRHEGPEDLTMKAQGVAGLQGTYTSGTTAPPTGNLAPGVLFPGGTAGPVVEPTFLPGISEMRFYPNVIASLFPSMPVSGPIVSYVREETFTNNAAAVPEGATKPTSQSGVKRYSEQIGKIANLERVTDEMIQDAPYFWALVQRRGVFGVTRKEEIELLVGTGMPGINGLYNRSVAAGGLSYPAGFNTPTVVTPVTNVVIGGAPGAGTGSVTLASVTPGRKFTLPTDYTKGTAAAEAILQAITDIRMTWFYEPDAVLMNPVDWQTIRLAKDANGQYLGGSFFGTNYGQAANAGAASSIGVEQGLSLWNKRVVSTPVQPQGLPIVGDFADGGQVLRLGGLRVDLTNTNGFDYEQNLWTMRIEERVGLLIDHPELFEIIQFA